MNKPKLLNLLLLLLLWQLTAITHAQDTTSYVRPWPLESLRMPEQVRMQTNAKQGIPRYLQNHTFADTIVDTTEWEDLYDVEVIFAKSIGTYRSSYTPDIELLDDGGFLIPWYDYRDDIFYITRLDSMANEVYTKTYDNIYKANLSLYRDGNYIYMAGLVNTDTISALNNHVALIKYDLELNDTVFLKTIRPYYGAVGAQISFLHKDSIFYIAPSYHHNYIYTISKQGLVLDSINNNTWLRGFYNIESEIYSMDYKGIVYDINGDTIDSVGFFDSNIIKFMHIDRENLYLFTTEYEIVKYNKTSEKLFVSYSEDIEFSNGLKGNAFTAGNKCLVAAVGCLVDGIYTQEAYTLVKLTPDGNWLHKLTIEGANYYDQRVYELHNGNYLLTARMGNIPDNYGALFFASIKKWDDGVGIPASPAPKPLAVYPNPTSGKITIKLQTPQKGNIAVMNLAGQVVHTENLSKTDYPTKTVNIDHLPTGVYLLQLYSGATIKSTRIIKN